MQTCQGMHRQFGNVVGAYGSAASSAKLWEVQQQAQAIIYLQHSVFSVAPRQITARETTYMMGSGLHSQ